jgi:hypothetical protein
MGENWWADVLADSADGQRAGMLAFRFLCLEIGRRNVAFEQAQQTRIGRRSNRRTLVRSGSFPSAHLSEAQLLPNSRDGKAQAGASLRSRRPQHNGEFENLRQLVTNRANENGSARGTPKCCAAQSNVQTFLARGWRV